MPQMHVSACFMAKETLVWISQQDFQEKRRLVPTLPCRDARPDALRLQTVTGSDEAKRRKTRSHAKHGNETGRPL